MSLTATVPIPLVDLGWQHALVADEVAVGWARVVAECGFVGGTAVAGFEAGFAAACRAAHCVGVANGTDALELALRAAGVGAGDEVVLPAHTFVATGAAVVATGATPVLADVDPEHLLLDPAAAAAVRTRRTRVVIPVHLYGQPAPVDELRAALPGVTVVEDAAQAQGASLAGRPAGSLGEIAATSFYPGKNLGAYGDGGAVLTNDPDLARTVRALGNHGSHQRYRHELLGRNSRLDALQAVVLSAKLRHLTVWNAARRAAADRYAVLLAGVDGLLLPATRAGAGHVWHLYVVRVADRDRVLADLQADGIGAGVHYPAPLHLQPAFAGLGHRRGAFPHSERAADTVLSLPLFPGITPAQQERVAGSLLAALTR